MNTPNTAIETVNTGADKAKVALAAALVVAGIVAFYYLGQSTDLWKRVGALLALMAAGIAVFFTSEYGKQLIAFGRDAYREVGKVVWPSRDEATKMTLYVFLFVAVMGIFLFVVDSVLKLVILDWLLGFRGK
jgi:preprotein translocase subunit SecE